MPENRPYGILYQLSMNNERVIRIAPLESEVQAQLLDDLLTQQGVPHLIRSYHDNAYDGVFQTTLGWGHVEAPEQFREAVLSALNDLTQAGGAGDQ